MNISKSDTDLSALEIQYKSELDAAQKSLNANRSDLLHLITFIQDKDVTTPQRPNLLKQAYAQLCTLREGQQALTNTAPSEAAIATALEKTISALKSENLSLGTAFNALGEAQQLCTDSASDPKFAALILACQAQILAAQQEYNKASEHYKNAALTKGISTHIAWFTSNAP